ncbi:Holliday junction branch migration protein RuvA [Kaarinaea lacus]
MIGRIRGILLEKQAPSLLVEVSGISYELEAPMTTFYELPATGNEVILHTHLLVREDAQLLYGFASQQERLLFRTLIKVSGVGAKLALALLSGMSAQEFAQTVQHNDVARLTRVPGIGKKTAERLIIEMRDRLKTWAQPDEGSGAVAATPIGDFMHADPVKDAISALIALGYKPPEASRMVNALDVNGMQSEDIIRQALKSINV